MTSSDGRGGKRAGAGRPKGSRNVPAAKGDALLDARTRKESALAELRSLELRFKRGELVERAKSDLAGQQVIANARARFLGLPARAAPVVVAMTALEAELFLRALVYEALAELAKGSGSRV